MRKRKLYRNSNPTVSWKSVEVSACLSLDRFDNHKGVLVRFRTNWNRRRSTNECQYSFGSWKIGSEIFLNLRTIRNTFRDGLKTRLKPDGQLILAGDSQFRIFVKSKVARYLSLHGSLMERFLSDVDLSTTFRLSNWIPVNPIDLIWRLERHQKYSQDSR